jgi:hypothetical protein
MRCARAGVTFFRLWEVLAVFLWVELVDLWVLVDFALWVDDVDDVDDPLSCASRRLPGNVSRQARTKTERRKAEVTGSSLARLTVRGHGDSLTESVPQSMLQPKGTALRIIMMNISGL